VQCGEGASTIRCGQVYCNRLRLSTHLKEDIVGFCGRWGALRAPKLDTLSPPSDFSFPQREWPRLPFTARIERAQFHRARSANKKGTWPLPLHPSETARWTSTGDQQATLPILPSSLAYLFRGQPGRSSSARVERAHSYRAGSASMRTTRLAPSFLAGPSPHPLLELISPHRTHLPSPF